VADTQEGVELMPTTNATAVSPGRTLGALGGQIVTPEDPRYNEARLAWNLAVDQRPAAVAFPASAPEVAAVVRFAAEQGLRVAPQGTGHNAGPLGPLDDTILLKTERMREVHIDAHRPMARVEAGVLWAELVEAAALYGLAGLVGSSPDVGVVGYTLGGGCSLIGRTYGLCANSVRAIEVVTAEGRLVRCDQCHDPDLFWALRGGGGSFGIVTALELELLRLQRAYAGALFYPIERAGEVLHAWRDMTADPSLPDELTTMGRLLRLPPNPDLPEELRGQSFAVVHAYHVGEPAAADELLAPLRVLGPVMDTIQMVPIRQLMELHMDPPHPVPAAGGGLLLAELPPNALDAFVEIASEDSDVDLLTIELRHLGGALGRPNPSGGALPAIDGEYSMFAAGMVAAPEMETHVRAQVRALQAALGPWAARRMYLTLTESRTDPANFWDESSYQRLRRIKTTADPQERIRANHPVPTMSHR
jgi:FAD/FMN-containing dehydrogenase